MKKITYICRFCKKESEFLGQDIWEVKLPMGYICKPFPIGANWTEENEEPEKLTVYEEHVCLDCGVMIYELIFKVLVSN